MEMTLGRTYFHGEKDRRKLATANGDLSNQGLRNSDHDKHDDNNDLVDEWEDQLTEDTEDEESIESSDREKEEFRVVLDDESSSTGSSEASNHADDDGLADTIVAREITALPETIDAKGTGPISEHRSTLSSVNIDKSLDFNSAKSPTELWRRDLENKKRRLGCFPFFKISSKFILPSFRGSSTEQSSSSTTIEHPLLNEKHRPKQGNKEILRNEIAILNHTLEDLRLENHVYKDQVKAITQDWHNTEKELMMERYKRFEMDMENFRLRLRIQGGKCKGNKANRRKHHKVQSRKKRLQTIRT